MTCVIGRVAVSSTSDDRWNWESCEQAIQSIGVPASLNARIRDMARVYGDPPSDLAAVVKTQPGASWDVSALLCQDGQERTS